MSTNEKSLVALRGATTCEVDTPQAIHEATAELLSELLERNGADAGDLVSLIFTSTPDLISGFPAGAARELGLSDVPLLCAAEIAVAGSLPKCIRILAHLSSATAREDLHHVYLRGATILRTDLSAPSE